MEWVKKGKGPYLPPWACAGLSADCWEAAPAKEDGGSKTWGAHIRRLITWDEPDKPEASAPPTRLPLNIGIFQYSADCLSQAAF